MLIYSHVLYYKLYIRHVRFCLPNAYQFLITENCHDTSHCLGVSTHYREI